jgi:hypothetical protein
LLKSTFPPNSAIGFVVPFASKTSVATPPFLINEVAVKFPVIVELPL